jgi:Ca2+-binding EF-hand superfamily protein
MRSAAFLAVLSLLSLISSWATADEPKEQGRRTELLQKFDKNGDGKLDQQEVAAAREALGNKGKQARRGADEPAAEALKRFDKNGDGKLDAQEIAAARAARMKRGEGGPRRGPGGEMPGREALLKKFDKNGNGKLDPDELAQARAQLGRRPGKEGK